MAPPNPPLPVEWVEVPEIRNRFNALRLFERLQSGEISQHVKRSRHVDDPAKGEPWCTNSQIAYYYATDGRPLAVVHQYRRPDGTIGASGLPDPKRLFLPDKILSIRTKAPSRG